jgi:DNA repair photolyase
LAAMGESIQEGHNVEYFTIPTRSILNRCTSARMPFTWTINPYRGCEFACRYCYARYTHEFMEMRNGLDFERKIYVKQNVSWLLRRDLKKVRPGEDIAIGTATDPYQPAERRYGITRAILEELSRHAGLEIGMVSKSTMMLRDIDIMHAVARQNHFGINITVTTLKTDLARILEPRAPRPDLRLKAVQELSAAGLHVSVLCCPVLPGITDSPKDLEEVVRAAAEAGARSVHSNPLFLKPCSEKVFMPFLQEKFPHLVDDYRKRYGAQAFVSSAYRKRISELMRSLCRKYVMGLRNEENAAATAPVALKEQLALF